MSAAFEFHEYVCWGTTGTISGYLEDLSRRAEETPGISSELRLWLKGEQESFFSGKVVCLDSILADHDVAWDFLALFETVTQGYIAGDEFTERGQEWLRDNPPRLRGRILHALHGGR